MQKSIYSDDYQHFLAELRSARVDAGVSQEQLAAALGEHQTFISKVERGIRRLDVVELRQWVEALDIAFPAFCQQLDARLSRHRRPTSPARKR